MGRIARAITMAPCIGSTRRFIAMITARDRPIIGTGRTDTVIATAIITAEPEALPICHTAASVGIGLRA